MTLTDLNASAAAAEMFLLAAICTVLLVDLFLRDAQRGITYALSLLALAGTALVAAFTGGAERELAFLGSYILDPAARVLKLFAIGAMALVFVYSRGYLRQINLFRGEYFLLGMFALLGIMVMVSAGSMLTIYLGLELLTLSMYALVAFNRDSPTAAESAMKFFVLGAIASGSLLYGISMIYGATGSIQLDEVAAAIIAGTGMDLMLAIGLAFVLVGIAFKFGAVPFHMWLPDVYQGSPTSVTLLVGSVPKIAAFALVLRVLFEGLGDLHSSWQGMIVILAVLSLVLGNVVAIAQTNVKRMLAYSTISHMGFVLIGVLAGNSGGMQAAMFYTLVYVLMAAGAFGMVILLSRQGYEAEGIDDFKGLNVHSPWFALIMLILMFGMAGVPPFAGFYAKVAVLGAAIEAGYVWLAVLGVMSAVIGAYYYLRIVWFMYFEQPGENLGLSPATDLKLMVSLNGLLVLALGLFPGPLFTLVANVGP